MKTLIIIIPGSKTKHLKLLDPFLNLFYNFFGVEKANDNWEYKFKKYLKENTDFDVEVFSWSRGITKTFSIKPASKDLINIIKNKENKYDSMILFCKSLGGIVGEMACKKYSNSKVKKIIFVATPHGFKELNLPSKIQITNIYSTSDHYQSLGNLFLNLRIGTKQIKNGRNIEIGGLNHSQLNQNINFNYKGQQTKLFDFCKRIILP